MKWFKGNPTPFIYGGILLSLILGTVVFKDHKKNGSSSLGRPAKFNATATFAELAERFQRQLAAPKWQERRSGSKMILLKENLKVVIPSESGKEMILIAYLLSDRTGPKLVEQMTEWVLLTGCIDTTAMNWLADECIPTLTRSKDQRINGLRCTFNVIEEDGSYWCILAFRPSDEPIPANRATLPLDPAEAIRSDVKKRVDSSMRRSGYFRISSR